MSSSRRFGARLVFIDADASSRPQSTLTLRRLEHFRVPCCTVYNPEPDAVAAGSTVAVDIGNYAAALATLSAAMRERAGQPRRRRAGASARMTSIADATAYCARCISAFFMKRTALFASLRLAAQRRAARWVVYAGSIRTRLASFIARQGRRSRSHWFIRP